MPAFYKNQTCNNLLKKTPVFAGVFVLFCKCFFCFITDLKFIAQPEILNKDLHK